MTILSETMHVSTEEEICNIGAGCPLDEAKIETKATTTTTQARIPLQSPSGSTVANTVNTSITMLSVSDQSSIGEDVTSRRTPSDLEGRLPLQSAGFIDGTLELSTMMSLSFGVHSSAEFCLTYSFPPFLSIAKNMTIILTMFNSRDSMQLVLKNQQNLSKKLGSGAAVPRLRLDGYL
jgi:hypothetical protein